MSKIIEADKALKDKEYKLSIKLYRVATLEEPNNPIIYQGLGWGLIQIKDYDEAMSVSNKALELAPDLFLPHVVKAYVYFSRKDLGTFRIEAKRAYELNPHSAEVLTCYGTMLLVDRDLDACIEILTKALQIDPSELVTYNNLALAFLLKGDAKKALEQTKKMYFASPSIKSGMRLIVAFCRAHPYSLGVVFLLLILLSFALHATYILIPLLLTVIYGVWLSFRLIFIRNWKSGIYGIMYSILMLVILYVTYNSIR